MSDADQWIISKLAQCELEVDRSLQQNRFADAVKAVYKFSWHEFCDWYLEFIKPVMYNNDSQEKSVTQTVLAQTLNRMLRLLHPFAPFITEEIYQKLPVKGESIMVDVYPTPSNDKDWLSLGSEKSTQEMDMVKEVITAIRNIRGENRIKPSENITAYLVPTDDSSQKLLSTNKHFVTTLAKLKQCLICEPESLAKCAATPVRIGTFQVDVVIPLEGLVNFEEEIKRITKSIERYQREASRLTQRLTNEDFLHNAPTEIVDQGRSQLEELTSQIRGLQENLQRLSL